MNQIANDDYLFALDTETSQITFTPTTSQCIAMAMIVVKNDANFTEVNRFYKECAFDAERFKWDDEAQAIHGLSQQHLAEQEMMKYVADDLSKFIKPYVADSPMLVIAHNPNFDSAYLQQWLNEAGDTTPISHRKIDAFTAGLTAFNLKNSEEHFEFLGKTRGFHNAMEDIETSLEIIRQIRKKVGHITA